MAGRTDKRGRIRHTVDKQTGRRSKKAKQRAISEGSYYNRAAGRRELQRPTLGLPSLTSPHWVILSRTFPPASASGGYGTKSARSA